MPSFTGSIGLTGTLSPILRPGATPGATDYVTVPPFESSVNATPKKQATEEELGTVYVLGETEPLPVLLLVKVP